MVVGHHPAETVIGPLGPRNTHKMMALRSYYKV
jgi:hypothetical protein